MNVTLPTAFVTGASSGIGEAFALELGKIGYHVILTARRVERLKQTANRIQALGGSAEVMPADLAKEEDVDRLTGIIRSRRIDLLINNAGWGLYGPVTETDPKAEQEMIRVNILSLVSLTRAVLPQMTERNDGGILHVASTLSFMPTPYMAAYGASKAWVLHYSESLAVELRHTGVTVTALCPGSTRSEFAGQAGFRQKRTMSAEEVARQGLRALEQGRTFVIPGTGNRILTALPRWIPRPWMAKLVGRFFRDRS